MCAVGDDSVEQGKRRSKDRTINRWSDILEEVRVMASVVQVEGLILNKSNTEYAEEQEGSKRMCKDAGI